MQTREHTMKVQVSKVFAKFINDTAKKLGFKAHAEVVALRSSAYPFCTGDATWEGECDYDWKTGTFRVIEVSYPSEYYACSKYVTTRQLNEEFRRRGVKTAKDLESMVRDMFEI